MKRTVDQMIKLYETGELEQLRKVYYSHFSRKERKAFIKAIEESDIDVWAINSFLLTILELGA